mmetsp:Transcript_22533/g.56965  ORF Transcript_22533/g.56965 Transcript_22533/m.56965 type:complete len:1315 (+) Transcript_22533:590-4534(+)
MGCCVSTASTLAAKKQSRASLDGRNPYEATADISDLKRLATLQTPHGSEFLPIATEEQSTIGDDEVYSATTANGSHDPQNGPSNPNMSGSAYWAQISSSSTTSSSSRVPHPVPDAFSSSRQPANATPNVHRSAYTDLSSLPYYNGGNDGSGTCSTTGDESSSRRQSSSSSSSSQSQSRRRGVAGGDYNYNLQSGTTSAAAWGGLTGVGGGDPTRGAQQNHAVGGSGAGSGSGEPREKKKKSTVLEQKLREQYSQIRDIPFWRPKVLQLKDENGEKTGKKVIGLTLSKRQLNKFYKWQPVGGNRALDAAKGDPTSAATSGEMNINQHGVSSASASGDLLPGPQTDPEESTTDRSKRFSNILKATASNGKKPLKEEHRTDQYGFLLRKALSSRRVKQGAVGDCSFLAILNCLVDFDASFNNNYELSPSNRGGSKNAFLRSLFVAFIPEKNVILIKLYIDCEYRLVPVTPTVPISREGKILCAHSTTATEVWICLLEKAYVTISGGNYDFFGKGSNPNTDGYHLTGWVPETLPINFLMQQIAIGQYDQEALKIWDAIFEGMNSGRCVVCLGTGKIKDAVVERGSDDPEGVSVKYGIVQNHAYSVLKSHVLMNNPYYAEPTPTRLLYLKNPWGRCQWKGRFGPKDPVWDSLGEEFREAGLPTRGPSDDGYFWMEWKDVLQTNTFSHIYILWNKDRLIPKKRFSKLTYEVKYDDAFNCLGGNPQFKLNAKRGKKYYFVVSRVKNSTLSSSYIAAHAYKLRTSRGRGAAARLPELRSGDNFAAAPAGTGHQRARVLSSDNLSSSELKKRRTNVGDDDPTGEGEHCRTAASSPVYPPGVESRGGGKITNREVEEAEDFSETASSVSYMEGVHRCKPDGAPPNNPPSAESPAPDSERPFFPLTGSSASASSALFGGRGRGRDHDVFRDGAHFRQEEAEKYEYHLQQQPPQLPLAPASHVLHSGSHATTPPSSYGTGSMQRTSLSGGGGEVGGGGKTALLSNGTSSTLSSGFATWEDRLWCPSHEHVTYYPGVYTNGECCLMKIQHSDPQHISDPTQRPDDYDQYVLMLSQHDSCEKIKFSVEIFVEEEDGAPTEHQHASASAPSPVEFEIIPEVPKAWRSELRKEVWPVDCGCMNDKLRYLSNPSFLLEVGTSTGQSSGTGGASSSSSVGGLSGGELHTDLMMVLLSMGNSLNIRFWEETPQTAFFFREMLDFHSREASGSSRRGAERENKRKKLSPQFLEALADACVGNSGPYRHNCCTYCLKQMKPGVRYLCIVSTFKPLQPGEQLEYDLEITSTQNPNVNMRQLSGFTKRKGSIFPMMV